MAGQVQKVEKNFVTESVMSNIQAKIDAGSISVPANYNMSNAITSAYLILKAHDRDVLNTCAKESIANALLDMVVQGLNPVKDQCYFIPYKDKLTLQRSYLGTVAITKRLDEVVDVKGYPVYKNDNFTLGFDIVAGVQYVKEYEPSTDYKESDLVGAFAVIIGEYGILHTEYMSMDQIRKSWEQGAMKGNSPAHKNFASEMAKKTVINRACKMYAKTSDDADLICEMMKKDTDDYVDREIEEHANSEMVEIYPSEDVTDNHQIEVEQIPLATTAQKAPF